MDEYESLSQARWECAGQDERVIGHYIRNQEREDERLHPVNLYR